MRDLAELERWDDFQEAFTTMLERTSTTWAPWYVIPANDKKCRNLVIRQILVDTLTALDIFYAAPEEDVGGFVID